MNDRWRDELSRLDRLQPSPDLLNRAVAGDVPSGQTTPRRGRLASLIVGVVLAGLLSTGLAAVVLVRRGGNTPSDVGSVGAGRLEVSSVDLTGAREDGKQGVSIRFAWSGSTFPGIFRCTIEARGDDGTVVGTFADEVVSLQPVSTAFTVPVPVSRAAATVDAHCDANRVDAGGTYAYDFAGLAVSHDRGATTVDYSYEWLGTGYPGVVTCDVVVYDGAGQILVTQPTNFYKPGGQGKSSLTLPVDEGIPVEAEFADCRPFS